MITDDYRRMHQDAVKQGVTGLDKFYSVFSADLRPHVKECGHEWIELTEKLGTEPVKDSQDLRTRLKHLLKNNAKWLELSARQFVLATGELG